MCVGRMDSSLQKVYLVLLSPDSTHITDFLFHTHRQVSASSLEQSLRQGGESPAGCEHVLCNCSTFSVRVHGGTPTTPTAPGRCQLWGVFTSEPTGGNVRPRLQHCPQPKAEVGMVASLSLRTGVPRWNAGNTLGVWYVPVFWMST